MIELAFGESAAGGLKHAKSREQGQELGGAVAMMGGSQEDQYEVKKLRKWSGITMEGNSKDVEALPLALDIGDISDVDTDMNARKKLLDSWFEDFLGAADKIWETNQHALMRILEAKSTMEHIRMWVSTSDPAEMCGLYFICHRMVDANTPLSVVRIPKEIQKDNSIVCYRNIGEIAAEELGALTVYEEPISKLQRKVYANIWADQMRENAPLRAIINGILIGVPEDFYDFALRNNIPNGEFKAAQLIGKTLSQMPGVSDRWLFLRIRTMIQSRELIQVSESTDDHPYSAVIRRNSKIVT